MSDKQPNPAPDGKPAGGDPLSGLAGPSIDDLLAEAESLAENLAQQVGVATEEPAAQAARVPPSHDETTTTAPPAAATPDDAPTTTAETIADRQDTPTAEVDGIEQSPPIEQAASEASPGMHDAPADTANSPANVSGGESQSEPGDSPTAEAEPARATNETREPATTTPLPSAPESPVTADDHAVVDDEINAVAANVLTAAQPPSQAATSALPVESPPVGRFRRIRRRVADGIKAAPRLLASAPGWAIFGLLWLIDVPFAWMSPALKTKVGYIGVVTAVMAAVAWAMVLLGYGG